MMKVTECLNAEHDVFLAQLDRLDLSLNKQNGLTTPSPHHSRVVGSLQGMVEIIRVAVERHAHMEEGGLYKALEPHLGRDQGPLAVMEMEHEEIRKTVNQIMQWKPGEDESVLKANIAHFSEVLRGHIDKEVHALFPMAERLLGEAKLQELAGQCSSCGHGS